MHRRKLLIGMSNLAASWRGMLSRLFSPASGIRAVAISGAGGESAETYHHAGKTIVGPARDSVPNFEDYATIEARVKGEPVYCLDYMMYIYGSAPDLMPGIVMQEGNGNSCVKIKPKKSWEIKHNLLGSNSEQHPRTPFNDTQPFLPVHLIDGDPGTVWCSFGLMAPDVHPEWIRIDLPIESTVASVALVLSNKYYPGTDFGRSLPKELTVKSSRDAWHWETVYESQDVNIETPEVLEIKFEPRRAKQIWVIGNNFTKRTSLPSSFGSLTFFSIGEMEVRDPAGNDLALVSRGAGVTVSSTNFTHYDNRLTQNALWGPLHYDVGMKWLRASSGGGGMAYQWPFIEKERGRYEVDPVLDQWFTDVRRCGIDLILGLDITVGNPIYQNPPKKVNWSEARWKGVLVEAPFLPGTGGWVDQTPEMGEAWLRYVDFVVRHFKDRAYIWEIGNEWTDPGWDYKIAERYMKIFEKTYEAVKRADPNARIMPGATAGFAPDLILTLLGGEQKSQGRNPIKPGWASKIDGLSWHPSNPPDRAYFSAVREMQKQCREMGFKGRFYADELFFFFSYPSTAAFPMSELQQGIATMISAVGHSGLDTLAVTQILNYTGYSGCDSNCRQSWPSEIAVPVQPSVMYYMWRTLATVLDDFHPAEFQVGFTEEEKLLWFTFERGIEERMFAVWLAHAGANDPNEIVEARSDVTLPGIRAKQAWVVDLMNGTEQQLMLASSGNGTVIKGLRIKNYPTIIRFIQ